MDLGDAIKTYRKKIRMSQVELARRSKVTQAAISQIESGQRPGEETLRDICDALGIPVALIYILALERNDFGKYCTDREWGLVVPSAKFMLMQLCGGGD